MIDAMLRLSESNTLPVLYPINDFSSGCGMHNVTSLNIHHRIIRLSMFGQRLTRG